jgi:hypothetical protein
MLTVKANANKDKMVVIFLPNLEVEPLLNDPGEAHGFILVNELFVV